MPDKNLIFPLLIERLHFRLVVTLKFKGNIKPMNSLVKEMDPQYGDEKLFFCETTPSSENMLKQRLWIIINSTNSIKNIFNIISHFLR